MTTEQGTGQETEQAINSEWRTFGSVQEPFTKYQIKDGDKDPELKKLNDPVMTFNGPIYPPVRQGDKFVEFHNGLFVTNDPECIAWCEAKYPVIFDMDDPTSEEIVALERIRTPTAEYEPLGNVAGVGKIIDGIKDRNKRAVDAAVAKAKAEWEAERSGSQITPSVSSIDPAGSSVLDENGNFKKPGE